MFSVVQINIACNVFLGNSMDVKKLIHFFIGGNIFLGDNMDEPIKMFIIRLTSLLPGFAF